MPIAENSFEQKLTLGISACLLGEEVRYDGGHKRNRYVMNSLVHYFDFIPVCPEVAIGMSVPRPPIHLTGELDDIRVVGVDDSSLDVTDKLHDYGKQQAKKLKHISGYILKSGSPSCGMERVKRYSGENRQPMKDAVGAYAQALMNSNPLLPVEEEGRLQDPVLRENFIERIFVYYRWQMFLQNQPTIGKLVEFHAQHKYALLAHSQDGYKELGQLVANQQKLGQEKVFSEYGSKLMSYFKIRATRKNNTNVLQHIQGYLKEQIDTHDKQELNEVIEQYRIGLVPLVVPITLLRHHFRKYTNDYIQHQTYMNPYPQELMLRNLI